MEENDQALIDWVNTFNLPTPSSSLNELSDGTILIAILAEISPEHFDRNALSIGAAGNWVLCATNIKKLLRLLDDYYKMVLKKSIDMSCVDVNAIAKTSDPDNLLELLELIVGAAVMCERKATFIQAIFRLDHISQAVLKGMVEHAIDRMRVYPPEGEEGDSRLMPAVSADHGRGAVSVDGDPSEELIRAREMVRHLQEERNRLLGVVGELEAGYSALQQEASVLQARREQTEKEREISGGERDSKEALAIAARNQTLQMSLDDAKRELDLREVETESLKADLRSAKQRQEAMREIQSRLEMESSQMVDELDVGRDKGIRLIKAETQIVKYQQRLEEMNGLKKLNKELSEKNDQYLDQIHELESSNRGIDTLRKQVDEYKVKNIKLETEKFEAISESQVKEHEMDRMTVDLASLSQAKRLLEDELQSAREETAAAAEEAKQPSQGLAAEGGLFEVETVTSLREKLKRVERELQQFRASGEAMVSSDSSTEIAALQSEIEEVKRSKKEREDALLANKKLLSDTQSELHKVVRAHEQLQQQASSGSATKEQTKALKDQESRLLQTENTVRLLEESLKEKEGTINRLEQEKGKLENYAKRTLTAFKDKYMTALQGMKQEKRTLEDRLALVTARAEHNQETSRREERLMLSAMYELGLHVMDKKIQDLSSTDHLSPTHAPQTVLGVQRARIEQLSLAGGNVTQYAMTGPGSPLGAAATGAALGILSSNSGSGVSSSSHVTPVKH